MPSTTLHSLIPDVSELIELEQPDMARALMTCLLSLGRENLHFGNLTKEGIFTHGYPASSFAIVQSVASGAWAWLLGQGYLAQQPESMSSDFLVITPQGRRWFESTPKEDFEPRRQSPRGGNPETAPSIASSSPFGTGSERGAARVRINDLARELGIKSRTILDILTELGMANGKTHSSSLDSTEAEEVRAFVQHGMRSGDPEASAASLGTGHGMKNPRVQIDLSNVTKPGDVMKAILNRKAREEQASEAAAKETTKHISAFVAGTPGYTSEFCGVGGVGPVLDHLRVRGLADRFAELMVLRETRLPLAIGLFGNWGSGKSHFMNLMDRRIKALSEEQVGHKSPRSPASSTDKWCRQVVPIYFNAWHYSDSNLWASLVTQIFEALFDHLEPRADELKLLQSKLQRAGGVASLALEQVKDAHEDVLRASEELRLRQAEGDSARMAVSGFLNGLWALMPDLDTPQNRRRVVELLGVSVEDATFAELDAKRRELVSIRGRTTELLRRALARDGWARRLAWLIGVLAAVLLCRYGASSLPRLQRLLTGISPLVQALIVAISASIGWMVPVVRQVQSGLSQLEEWQKRAEDAQRECRQNPQILEAEKEIIRAEARARSAEVALAEAQSKESEFRRAVNELRPERRLAKFIESRARSVDYRGQLGLVSLARRDFEELSRIFTMATAPTETSLDSREQVEAFEELRGSIDRVVLFIDDLDRCEPEKVVDVLQAVHLLLAYPLFGVVVGVDQRCLRQSLRMRFKGLLTPDEPIDGRSGDLSAERGEVPATPLDYLEKIFHIPFHLPPMDEQGFGVLVERLTETVTPLEPQASDRESEMASTPTAARVEKREGGGKPVEAPISSIGSVPLYRWERDALKEYHPLIHTPRGATRLLNTYRLVRAGVPSNEWNSFRGDEGGRGESRLAMLLLAIAAGKPAMARSWFRILREQPDNLTATSELAGGSRVDWESFRRSYEETKKQVKRSVTPEMVSKWIDRVELFTF